MTTVEQLRKDKLIVAKVLTGSSAYRLATPESDKDYIGVFYLPKGAIPWENPKSVFGENGTFYEVNYFASLLKKGDPKAIEILWTLPYNLDYWNSYMDPFKRIFKELISKETLTSWLNTASVYYSAAIRLGAIKLNPVKAIDFARFTSKSGFKRPKTEPLTEVFKRGSFDANVMGSGAINTKRIGLVKLDGSDNTYLVYRDYALPIGNNSTIKGLLDENEEFIENGITNDSAFYTLTLEGVLQFDKKRYERNKKIQKQLQDNKIINGYSTKSMMHAFRLLDLIGSYLKNNHLDFEVKNIHFFQSLRKGEVSYEDAVNIFNNTFMSTKALLDRYDERLITDIRLIHKALEEFQDLVYNKQKYDCPVGVANGFPDRF